MDSTQPGDKRGRGATNEVQTDKQTHKHKRNEYDLAQESAFKLLNPSRQNIGFPHHFQSPATLFEMQNSRTLTITHIRTYSRTQLLTYVIKPTFRFIRAEILATYLYTENDFNIQIHWKLKPRDKIISHLILPKKTIKM